MKRKSLIVLPLVATMLGGCNILGFQLPSLMDLIDPLGWFHGKDGLDGAIDKTGKAEILGYRRVDNPVDGKSYLFGYYDFDTDQMRFANGDYHRVGTTEYPFYMATTENTDEGAAEFTVNYISEDEFTLTVSCDSVLPWDSKMLSIYEAQSSYNNYVMSIANVDDIEDQYTTPKGEKVDVYGRFKFYKTVEINGIKYAVNTIGMEYQYVGAGDTTEVLRLFGCTVIFDGEKRISIDCSGPSSYLTDEYAIAHLYEKI